MANVIRVGITLDADQFQDMVKKAGGSIEGLGVKTKQTGTAFSKFSAILAGAVAGAVSALLDLLARLGMKLVALAKQELFAVIKAFSDYEEALTNFNTIARLTDSELQKTSDAVKTLAVQLGKSPKEMIEALYQIQSAGVKGADGLKVLEQATKLAIGGLTDSTTAADAMTTALASFGSEGETAESIADAFFKTVELGKVTMDGVAKNFGKFGAVAKALGMSLDETQAAFAAMSLSGEGAERTATKLGATLNMIIKPSDKLSGAFEEATGKTIQLYTEQNGLVATLQKIIEFTGGSTEALGKLGIEQQALQGILQLSQNSFGAVTEAMKEMENKTGSADSAFQKQTATLSYLWKQFKAVADVIRVEIGEAAGPVLHEIAMELGAMAVKVREFLKEKENVDAIRAVFRALWQAAKDIAIIIEQMVLPNIKAFGKSGKDSGNEFTQAMSGVVTILDLIVKLLKLVEILTWPARKAIEALYAVVGKMSAALSWTMKKLGKNVEDIKVAAEIPIEPKIDTRQAEEAVKKLDDGAKETKGLVSGLAKSINDQIARISGKVIDIKTKLDNTDMEKIKGLKDVTIRGGKVSGTIKFMPSDEFWGKLDKFLLGTIHRDNAVMMDHLSAISKNTRETADKMPETADWSA